MFESGERIVHHVMADTEGQERCQYCLYVYSYRKQKDPHWTVRMLAIALDVHTHAYS